MVRETVYTLVVPGYFVLAIRSAARQARAATEPPKPRATTGSLRYFFRSCAAFPLGCLALISLTLFFDRLP